MFENLFDSVIDVNEIGISRTPTHVKLQRVEEEEEGQKKSEFYVTVTKHNLIPFYFIRLYNFREKKNFPFTQQWIK